MEQILLTSVDYGSSATPISWSILSFLFFLSTRALLRRVHLSFVATPPLSYITNDGSSVTPPLPRVSTTAAWKWVNTANSLFHSFVTGLGALLCFYLYPLTMGDVVTTHSTLSHALTAFSVGYFKFDVFDMLTNCPHDRATHELLAHHSLVLSCFGMALITRTYLGFVMVALVIEVNSIFLHWRRLLLLGQVPKCSTYYRAVSLLNLSTFVLFRIATLGWMTRWLALNPEKVTLPGAYPLGCVAMAVLVSMSIVLFLRLLRADFHSSSNKQQGTAGSGGSSPSSCPSTTLKKTQ